jgi:hypothetical protein
MPTDKDLKKYTKSNPNSTKEQTFITMASLICQIQILTTNHKKS